MEVFLHIVSRASELTQDQDRLPNIVISKGYVREPSDWNSSGRFGFALSVLAFLQVFYCFLNFGLGLIDLKTPIALPGRGQDAFRLAAIPRASRHG
ncbi:hypothetical protein F2Q68_00041794 [Brassica cretica]|uniref:Uncharacterized protein n=1 Tax=Brassica cretica TaxID=69181 RepID=A0A8S9MIU5_BRACR|nr:hypothetical protein F2Q68_00041794 [Brassica cretica]